MPYAESWVDLQRHPVPRWLRAAKFGIYTHWGPYAVPACGPNATWYGYNMYREGSPQHAFHVRRFGDPAVFGYKDFLPLFTGSRFDPDEWADLFARAGARFAGPVGEHHDGFAMWDSALSEWNAARMGPRRDVVGELERAVRARGMRFLVTMHHAENWWFYPHWKERYDTSDPRCAGLYGEAHDQAWSGSGAPPDPDPARPNHNETWPLQARPSERFLDLWRAKLDEVVDRYGPDLLWFDFGLRWIPEPWRRGFAASYYNRAEARAREVSIAYKWHCLPPGCGVEDIEQGGRAELSCDFWLTDTTVDAGEAWGYVEGQACKSAGALVHYLVDNVSKNGALLLSVGPRADGTIPDEVRDVLESVGRWLALNGEAIYGTCPWVTEGEGPALRGAAGAFTEYAPRAYTGSDIRFTAADDVLYAVLLAWPGPEAVILSVPERLHPGEIRSVRMLGVDQPLAWRWTEEALRVRMPERRPCEHAWVLRIDRKHPFRG